MGFQISFTDLSFDYAKGVSMKLRSYTFSMMHDLELYFSMDHLDGKAIFFW